MILWGRMSLPAAAPYEQERTQKVKHQGSPCGAADFSLASGSQCDAERVKSAELLARVSRRGLPLSWCGRDVWLVRWDFCGRRFRGRGRCCGHDSTGQEHGDTARHEAQIAGF